MIHDVQQIYLRNSPDQWRARGLMIQCMAQRNKIKSPESMTAILTNHLPALPAVPVLHAVEGGEGVEEHVEQPVV